jgi:protein gp37
MSDLFHKDVPFEFIERVFDVMKRAHWHQFQVLTKRRTVAELSPFEWAETSGWVRVSKTRSINLELTTYGKQVQKSNFFRLSL